MPIAVACRCGQRLRVKDELAGKHVRCPKCGGTVEVPLDLVVPSDVLNLGELASLEAAAQVVQTSASSRPPLASGGRSGPQPTRSKAALNTHQAKVYTERDLNRMRTGIRAHWASMLGVMYANAIVAVGILVGALEMSESSVSSAAEVPPAFWGSFLILVSGLIICLSGWLDIVGLALCIQFPTTYGSRYCVIAALLFRIVSLVAYPLALVSGASRLAALIVCLTFVLGSWISQMLAFSRFARFLNRDELEAESFRILVVGIAVVAGLVAAPLTVGHLIANGQGEALSVLGVLILGVLAVSLWTMPGKVIGFALRYGTLYGPAISYLDFVDSLCTARRWTN